ncbi:RHS repeat-associated core domain-containing protein, partial [Paracidovorax avenae]|uniref:RHS repeat-associated core domain-containing protein n=1 Tax=Paracidovorax avenae TaxID=80867 RepID=UPI001E3DAC67
VEFRYDALGRRIAKQDAFGRTEFIWEGMRLIEERRGSKVVSYVYEPGSYVPLARIDADGQRLEGSGHGGLVGGAGADAAGPAGTQGHPGSQSSRHAALNPMAAPGSSAVAHAASAPAQVAAHAQALIPAESRLRASAQVSYFHTDPSGLPEEVTDEAGEVRWRASWRTWGSALEERWEAVRIDGSAIPAVQQRHRDKESLEQNLRLQGQYLDRETGLHYNTFRYYDPDVGRFISPDPIGLQGGLNLQQYAPNPLAWIDPWGWSFMESVAGAIERTGKKFQGAEIYKFTDKVKVGETTFKRGDYFYLDNLHKDHYETFSKNDSSKGVFNLDGSKNERKSIKAANRKGPGC